MAWVLYGGDDVEVRGVETGRPPALVPGAQIQLFLDEAMAGTAATPADIRMVGGGALTLPLYVDAYSQVPEFEARDDVTLWYRVNSGPVERLYPKAGPLLDTMSGLFTDDGKIADSLLPSTIVRTIDVARQQRPVSAQGSSIAALLDHGADAVVTLAGDSTGNATDEWFYRWLQLLGARYPTYRIEHRLWSDATQSYPAATVVQAGPAASPAVTGEDRFTTARADLYGSMPDTVGAFPWSGASNAIGAYVVAGGKATYTGGAVAPLVLDAGVGGDQSVRVIGTANTTQASAQQWRVYAKSRDSATYVAILGQLLTAGATWTLTVQVAGVGVTLTSWVTPPVTNGAGDQVIDATLTVAGRVVTATVNGSTVTGTLTVAQARALQFGSGGGFYCTAAGHFYDSIVITTTRRPPLLTAYNGSMPGSTLAYHAARSDLVIPERPDLLLVSSCHNYATSDGTAYVAAVKAFLDLVRVGTGASIASRARVQDTFTRTAADLRGSDPDIGAAWGGPTGNIGMYSVGSGVASYVGNGTGGAEIVADGGVAGDHTVTLDVVLPTNVATSRVFRVHAKYLDASNHVMINATVSSAGGTWTLVKRIGGTVTTLATWSPAPIPLGQASVAFSVTLSVAGTAATATINGVPAPTPTALTAGDVTVLAPATGAGFFVAVPGATVDNFTLTVPALPPVHADLEVVVSGQNPETPAYYNRGGHLARLAALRPAALRYGWGYLPVSEAYLATPGWEALVMADGVHTQPAGSDLWAAVAASYFSALSRLQA